MDGIYCITLIKKMEHVPVVSLEYHNINLIIPIKDLKKESSDIKTVRYHLKLALNYLIFSGKPLPYLHDLTDDQILQLGELLEVVREAYE
jgi:hypothetical protein